MKQTAVEWLAEQFEKIVFYSEEAKEYTIKQAKEMEKEQLEQFQEQDKNKYSEEEVIAFGEFIFKHSLLTHTRGVKSLFEEFKTNRK